MMVAGPFWFFSVSEIRLRVSRWDSVVYTGVPLSPLLWDSSRSAVDKCFRGAGGVAEVENPVLGSSEAQDLSGR